MDLHTTDVEVEKKTPSPTNLPIRREKDSLDDFEHLGLDSSPLQEVIKEGATAVSSAARDLYGKIDKGFESAGSVVGKIVDDVFDDPFGNQASLIDSHLPTSLEMDSNLLEMGDTIMKNKESDDKLDKFLSELTYAPAVPSHEVSPLDEEIKLKLDGIKTATQNFMDSEREDVITAPSKTSSNNDDVDRYLYNEPKMQETRKEADFSEKRDFPETKFDGDFKNAKDDFGIFDDVIQPEPVVKKDPSPVREILKPVIEPEILIPKPAPAPVAAPVKEAPVPVPTPKVEIKPEEKPIEIFEKVVFKPAITDAEAIFKKMGLDAWFHPERLDPKVESLIYWRDPKKSGPVFGGVLVVLLSLTYLSLISVVAYVSLLGLTATISFRIYKNIVQAVQKTGDGHPFKEFLEKDVALSQDKVQDIVQIAVAHANAAINELRRLFLVEDLVDSIKFGGLLWLLTYLGACFNGMTLIIIAWVALFTLPKVYETNKTQIDANLDLVRSRVEEITSKVKAAIPIGKKAEEKKEQ